MSIRGEGWRADCRACVGSKFTCDEHYVPAQPAEQAIASMKAAIEAEQALQNRSWGDPLWDRLLAEKTAALMRMNLALSAVGVDTAWAYRTMI